QHASARGLPVAGGVLVCRALAALVLGPLIRVVVTGDVIVLGEGIAAGRGVGRILRSGGVRLAVLIIRLGRVGVIGVGGRFALGGRGGQVRQIGRLLAHGHAVAVGVHLVVLLVVVAVLLGQLVDHDRFGGEHGDQQTGDRTADDRCHPEQPQLPQGPVFGEHRTSGGTGGVEGTTGQAVRRHGQGAVAQAGDNRGDRKSTRLNSSHVSISYAVFCLKKKISHVAA